MARTIVAGNWKMNLGPAAGRRFVEDLELSGTAAGAGGGGPEMVVFPPSLTFGAVRDALGRPGAPPLRLGVQNVHHEDEGAFTGEVSAAMAAEAGATFVLVGHSERRHIFGEADRDTREKVAAVLRHDLVPVLCVGETLDERKGGRLEQVILRQLDAGLAADGLRDALGDGRRLVLAYEPVWAIGTGETATPEDASEAHGLLRDRLATLLGEVRSRDVPILYGGSVKPGNATELLGAPEVDGVLVGGASLDPNSFAGIVRCAS